MQCTSASSKEAKNGAVKPLLHTSKYVNNDYGGTAAEQNGKGEPKKGLSTLANVVGAYFRACNLNF